MSNLPERKKSIAMKLEIHTMKENNGLIMIIMLILSLITVGCSPTSSKLQDGSAPTQGPSTPVVDIAEAASQTSSQVEDQPVESYINISTPEDGAVLDPGEPILVSGMAAGLIEGNVVVHVADQNGTVIALDATTVSALETWVGAEGPWRIELRLEGIITIEGLITAYAPSPMDGSWIASDSVGVSFLPMELNQPPLEGTNWLLTGFADESLNVMLTTHLVNLSFDAEAGSLGGQAACNRYFSAYELGNQTLTLGPVGSTMMMCPETKMVLEAAFFTSLAEVSGYSLESGNLILNDAGGEMILRFRVDPFEATTSFTREGLANAAYVCHFREDCRVSLSNGEYYEPIEGSSAQISLQLSNHFAFGDLDGDGLEEAAVVLVSNTGGSGVFYDLGIVKIQDGELINLALISLGDRVLLNNLEIEAGEVVVTMIIAGPNDAMCCPSTPVTQRFRLVGNDLIMVE